MIRGWVSLVQAYLRSKSSKKFDQVLGSIKVCASKVRTLLEARAGILLASFFKNSQSIIGICSGGLSDVVHGHDTRRSDEGAAFGKLLSYGHVVQDTREILAENRQQEGFGAAASKAALLFIIWLRHWLSR